MENTKTDKFSQLKRFKFTKKRVKNTFKRLKMSILGLERVKIKKKGVNNKEKHRFVT